MLFETYMEKHVVTFAPVLFAISHAHSVDEANDLLMAYQKPTQDAPPFQVLQNL
jgi:hypothetical protein